MTTKIQPDRAVLIGGAQRSNLMGGVRGHLGRPAATAPALSANDTAWANLYGALVNGLGLSPANFQLIYPFTSWNWPVPNTGYTTSAQQDFCATMPQWSATGSYVSSGTTFDGAYQQFLNDIVAYTKDPTLAQQINTDQDALTTATNAYGTIYAQAQAAYASQVTDNDPTFTAWLGSPAGFVWQSQLTSAESTVTMAQNVLTSDTAKAQTPNLTAALTAMANQAYYTKLQDSGLSGFPAVPAYGVGQSAAAWVQQVQGGGATPGGLSFSNSQATYDYSQTWAKASASVGGWFWSVNASGSWQQASLFETDSSLQCNISFAAWDTIGITPQAWYSGATQFKNGPFLPGFSATQQPNTTWMFGQGGVVPAFKTGMIVCYQPSITLSVSTSTYQSFSSQWAAATGIQVGPFQFGGSAGGSKLNWSQTGSGYQLTTQSTSTVPLILGVTVNVLP